MYRYVVKRLLLAVPTLVGAAALVFVLMRLIPGDVCVIRLGSGGAHVDPAALANCRAELGLNDPWIVQFLDFLASYARFDFGISMWSGQPVTHEIASRLPVSLQIALMATVIAILLAIPLGTVSALKENSWLDHGVRIVAIAGIATPSFWLGIMSLVLVLDITYLATGKPWMPPIDYVPFWQDPLRNLSMVLLPVVTLIGIEFAFLIGGLVVTEQVFNLNGIGRLFVLAVQNQDNVLTQALTMLVVVIFVVTNLVVDLLYAWLDPRIRFS